MARPPLRVPFIRFRPMEGRDIAQAVAIDSFGYHKPWDRRVFSNMVDGYKVVSRVVEDANEVIGFSICLLYRNYTSVLRFGVAWNAQRRGVGRYLLNEINNIHKETHKTVLVQVEETNIDALKFLQANGFVGRCNDGMIEMVWQRESGVLERAL